MITVAAPDTRAEPGLDKRTFAEEPVRDMDKSTVGKSDGTAYIWALPRFSLGWIFLWAFVDKLFGLGFATESGKGWIDGGSPIFGFLNFAARGPMVG